MSLVRVHIDKNGEEKIVKFPITCSVEFIENKMRSTYGVINGTLSSDPNDTVIVVSLDAGSDYYFREFNDASNVHKG